MSLVIYKDGESLRPWERFQEITDDYGNVWKAKMGDMVEHHWALRKGKYPIIDHEGMSEWHTNWQNILEKDCGYKLEQLRKDLLGYRKADALHQELKIVVEVQYSSISASDFYERTKFWIGLGYNVVWIFDPKKYSDYTGKYRGQYRWSRKPVWWDTYKEFRFKVDIIIQNSLKSKDRIAQELVDIIIQNSLTSKDRIAQELDGITIDRYYRILAASHHPGWKTRKYCCKVQSMTKNRLIDELKG